MFNPSTILLYPVLQLALFERSIMQQNTVFTPEALRLIGAALALHQVERTAASITSIPSTGRFVVIGTPAEVARLMEVGSAFANKGGEPDWKAYAAAEASAAGAGSEPAVVACEDCDGCGHDGDFQWQGHFQPPEPGMCNSCGGSGKALAGAEHDHSEGGHHD
jgi:hypothetical protein